MERVRRIARVAGPLIVLPLVVLLSACTSDDPTPEEDEPLRIDGPAHVDESLLDGPGADLDPGGGG